jgi:hypothetical protein
MQRSGMHGGSKVFNGREGGNLVRGIGFAMPKIGQQEIDYLIELADNSNRPRLAAEMAIASSL